jgi:recombinational DNA repair ATPase RecF
MERIFVSYKVRMSMTNRWTISFCAIRKESEENSSNGNKKEYERLSQHIGTDSRWSWFSPADASLIQGGSDERRHFHGSDLVAEG